MQLQINHSTTYRYDQPVSYALQKVRLRPLPCVLQTVDQWQVAVDGGKVEASYVDHYGNHTDLISVAEGAEALTISAMGQVSTADAAGIFGKSYGRAPLWHFVGPTPLTEPGAAIRALVDEQGPELATLDGLHALSAAILKVAPYEIGKTHAATPAEEAMTLGYGVCQDHAHIFVTAARLANVPARYVSGYLMMEGHVQQDASHAWAEAHVDGLGWVGFDVSNGICPDEKYVRIATGRDARDAAPISGLLMGATDDSMIVSLQVQQ